MGRRKNPTKKNTTYVNTHTHTHVRVYTLHGHIVELGAHLKKRRVVNSEDFAVENLSSTKNEGKICSCQLFSSSPQDEWDSSDSC